ncbi:MAG: DUF1453 domain-containing protein [Gammaproteobacteria bacterium]
MTPQALLPALVVPLILFGVYRRIRRTFGRQPVQPKRMIFRIVLMCAVATALVLAASHDGALLAVSAEGLVLGAILAAAGLRLTQFETNAQGRFYTPNAYVGAALTAVFLGRLVYRFITVTPEVHAAAQQSATTNPFDAFQRSPLTMAIFTMLIGYYLTYYAGVLWSARKQEITPAQ